LDFALGFAFSTTYLPAYRKFISAPTLITCLTMLICGIALLKLRKAVGLRLVMLGIAALFLWSLLIPEL
jgi:hypothetical protein